jgi:hypothetical protein
MMISVSSLDGSIDESIDASVVKSVSALRAELTRRFGGATVSLVRNGKLLTDDSASLAGSADGITVFVNKRSATGGHGNKVIATGLVARDLRDADEAERNAAILDALYASATDAPDESTYTVAEVPAAVLQSMIESGFGESRARKALLLSRFNLEDAVEWLALHQDDVDIDEPLSFAQLKALGAIVRRITITSCASLQAAVAAGVCTFAVTGKQFMPQLWFSCETCSFGEREGVCESCARRCHRGHKLSEAKPSRRFYCDCQATGDACSANGVFK